MININQTMDYLVLCANIGVEVTLRTREEVTGLLPLCKSEEDKKLCNNLVENPRTAEAQLELLRIQVSLRAMGVLPRHHPSAMINITNFQSMLLECKQATRVLELVERYGLGDISKYGSLMDMSKDIYVSLNKANKLENVFKDSNLNRLLALYECTELHKREAVSGVRKLVNLPYMKKTHV